MGPTLRGWPGGVLPPLRPEFAAGALGAQMPDRTLSTPPLPAQLFLMPVEGGTPPWSTALVMTLVMVANLVFMHLATRRVS
ncbi:hypothetical protein BK816_01660 [Boudabousia tangfeifanii]|uniref:Uncharacterized protein n=1 Tax=Boudabousia tangfeifanii TaxID=1912795 RepID=A0A1D9MIP9_9ACTO|nr:hypothetical protein [Boudabousia tangfeifanii]AOZ72162.1 hypothetical protein BK816_01660 [Boudabousia tangfeifanii]